MKLQPKVVTEDCTFRQARCTYLSRPMQGVMFGSSLVVGNCQMQGHVNVPDSASLMSVVISLTDRIRNTM